VAIEDIPQNLRDLYEVHEWRHDSAVLIKDFPKEWEEICGALQKFRLLKSRVAVPGGSKSLISAALDEPVGSLQRV
jgi:hypothetical protein